LIARTSPSASPFRIKVIVDASKQKEVRTATFELPFQSIKVDCDTLVDLKERKLRLQPPMQQQIADAISYNSTDWFERLEPDEDDEDDEG
jgi:hypothetical protein